MKKSIKDTVRDIVEPIINELGYDVWDVTYSKIGADWHLEITIDKEDGIFINDCEKVHRTIDPVLDELDPIEGFYYLDVSSPGIERELRTDKHIELSIGQKVEAKLFAAKDGKKSIVGILTSYDNGKVTVKENDAPVVLERSEISKLTTLYFED
jgi:ribosome maturation factor RimP